MAEPQGIQIFFFFRHGQREKKTGRGYGFGGRADKGSNPNSEITPYMMWGKTRATSKLQLPFILTEDGDCCSGGWL